MTEGEQEKNVIQVIVEDTGEEEKTAEENPSIGGESIATEADDSEDKEASKIIVGKNFTIDGDIADIFGQKGGKREDGLWDIYTGTLCRAATPEYKRDLVLAAIQEDIDHNVCDPTNRVIISPDVALFLFLEGVLKPEHFKTANENQVNTAPIFGDQDETLDPAITLSSVTFDNEQTFSVTILDCIGKNQAFTLDKNWGKI